MKGGRFSKGELYTFYDGARGKEAGSVETLADEVSVSHLSH